MLLDEFQSLSKIRAIRGLPYRLYILSIINWNTMVDLNLKLLRTYPDIFRDVF